MQRVEIAAKIAKLKSVFIRHDDITALSNEFDRQLALRRAQIEGRFWSEAGGIALVGASGSGKSTALHRIFSRHPDVTLLSKQCDGADVVSFQVPSPATLKFVGHQALTALGYPIQSARPAAYLWDMVKFHLKERRTLFLHLDEAQDLFSKRNEKEMRSVINTLKSIMQNRDWPVGVILSGLPDLSALPNLDHQLGRRIVPIQFPRIDVAQKGTDLRAIAHRHANAVDLIVDPDLFAGDFLERLVHAADGQFGITVELIIGAIEEALRCECDSLGHSHFVAAFERRSRCIPAFNPFVAEDFHRLNCRRLFEGTLGEATDV